jgi:hypothetical protein
MHTSTNMSHIRRMVRHSALIAISATLATVSANAGATNACQGIGGNWSDGTGAWTLSQPGGGHGITGLLTTNQGGQCNSGQHYTVAGSLTDGVLSMTATWRDDGAADNNPRPVGCAQTITYTGNVTGPGCNHGNGTWHNSGNLSNSFNLVGQCITPHTPIVTDAVRYVAQTGYTTQTLFQQPIVISGGFNFGGRTMGEKFPTPANMGCWGPGAPFSQSITLTSYQAPVPNFGNPIPSVYDDYMSLPDSWVIWIRQHISLLPCSMTAYQREYIDCSSNTDPDQFLQQNLLIFTVDNRTVRYNRGGTPTTDITFGPPPTKQILPSLLNPLLKHP